MQSLDGVGALVTGGGSGIGLATAGVLARDGAIVTIMGRSAERLEAARNALAETGIDERRVRAVAGDVADPTAVDRAVTTAIEAAGGLGIAVAAAGVAGTGPLLQATPAEVQPYIDTNLYGTLNVVRAAGLAMRETGGAICAVTSNVADRPSRFVAAYCASKAAVDALVVAAADELGPLDIRVNAVRPGLTETPMVARVLELSSYLEGITAATPLGGWSRAEEVASAIRFLVGPESARVTGQHIVVDGGQNNRRTTDLTSVVETLFPDIDPRLLS